MTQTQTKTLDGRAFTPKRVPLDFAYVGWADDQAEWETLLESHGGTIRAWTPDRVQTQGERKRLENDRKALDQLHETSRKYTADHKTWRKLGRGQWIICPTSGRPEKISLVRRHADGRVFVRTNHHDHLRPGGELVAVTVPPAE